MWPAGLSANPHTPGVLYTGFPNLHSIGVYTYAPNGALSFASQARDPDAVLPCWSVVSRDGRRLYFANAGSDNLSVWDVGSDPRNPRLHADGQAAAAAGTRGTSTSRRTGSSCS